MSQNSTFPVPILIAISDNWRDEVCKFLEQEGFTVLVATSRDNALALAQSRRLCAIVVTSDWAMASEDGKTVGLIEMVKGKTPTVTLIQKTYYGRCCFDEVFHPSLHEYCTVPVAAEQLLTRLRQVIQAVDESANCKGKRERHETAKFHAA
jgi:DNA-binding NtrC family response regulator